MIASCNRGKMRATARARNHPAAPAPGALPQKNTGPNANAAECNPVPQCRGPAKRWWSARRCHNGVPIASHPRESDRNSRVSSRGYNARTEPFRALEQAPLPLGRNPRIHPTEADARRDAAGCQPVAAVRKTGTAYHAVSQEPKSLDGNAQFSQLIVRVGNFAVQLLALGNQPQNVIHIDLRENGIQLRMLFCQQCLELAGRFAE